MDMERIAEHKLALQMIDIDLREILTEALDNFTREATLRQVKLETPSHKEAAVVTCDRTRLSQVLTNLLDNALKFTPSGGSISVELKKSEREVYIFITDSGPGLSEENQKKIFGRFEQIHSQDRQGLGLGLYISRMLVHAHGGILE